MYRNLPQLPEWVSPYHFLDGPLCAITNIALGVLLSQFLDHLLLDQHGQAVHRCVEPEDDVSHQSIQVGALSLSFARCSMSEAESGGSRP
jgi:hypothetical protein